eukprot:CAMPEP_0173413962 /NCGR_PEP_ID=MMETSP1356-20130122/83296_1 /TAXON_ID=77927 ORGANISM="Hemiselmis virescens, Strain PCC157" /NCGR_SAMPLE_ID=MMETSP1356 /ASSEMBLY_ACC=CAM_ASM_000847 /LENGTH=38 /DNA_ID= /DNA_START= /DNA_END= /DNA_ORIENTATION=
MDSLGHDDSFRYFQVDLPLKATQSNNYADSSASASLAQ